MVWRYVIIPDFVPRRQRREGYKAREKVPITTLIANYVEAYKDKERNERWERHGELNEEPKWGKPTSVSRPTSTHGTAR